MNTHRISTTISQRSWILLNKYAEKYHTQQKALEVALETLENNSKIKPMSPEEELWMRTGKEVKTVGLIQKDALRVLIKTADQESIKEFVDQQKPVNYTIEFLYQKPLKECGLKEVIDGLVVTSHVSCMVDSISYTDNGDHYFIKITHDMGMNSSKMLRIMFESMFSDYGVKTEFIISERSIFAKIFKGRND
jgi:hypothetical protein